MSEWTHGKTAVDEYIAHIANEVRPYAEKHGHSREEVMQASLNAVRKHFEQAWPEE